MLCVGFYHLVKLLLLKACIGCHNGNLDLG